MTNRNTYLTNWLSEGIRQESIMLKQVKRALNSFVQKYARTYQRSVIAINEPLLLNQHQERIRDILEVRYKFIIPFFSKFVLQDFRGELTKADEDVLLNQQDIVTQDYISKNAGIKSSIIATTSLDNIRSAIGRGVREGSSIDEIASSIRQIQAINTARAQIIARTEVHSAANYGSIETAKNAQREFKIAMVKEWLAVNDARTRNSHQEADGQVVDIGDTFRINGFPAERPLDSSLPASEVINCRCTMRFRKKEYDIN